LLLRAALRRLPLAVHLPPLLTGLLSAPHYLAILTSCLPVKPADTAKRYRIGECGRAAKATVAINIRVNARAPASAFVSTVNAIFPCVHMYVNRSNDVSACVQIHRAASPSPFLPCLGPYKNFRTVLGLLRDGADNRFPQNQTGLLNLRGCLSLRDRALSFSASEITSRPQEFRERSICPRRLLLKKINESFSILSSSGFRVVTTDRISFRAHSRCALAMATLERCGSKDFAGNRTRDDYRESPPYLAHMLDNYLPEVAGTIVASSRVRCGVRGAKCTVQDTRMRGKKACIEITSRLFSSRLLKHRRRKEKRNALIFTLILSLRLTRVLTRSGDFD